jgi:hypothetical protein
MSAKKLSLSERVEGPLGSFQIRYLKGRWEINRVTEMFSSKMANGRTSSLGRLQLVGSRNTRQQATDHARKLAGSFPPPHPLPDRRAAIEHTRGLS